MNVSQGEQSALITNTYHLTFALSHLEFFWRKKVNVFRYSPVWVTYSHNSKQDELAATETNKGVPGQTRCHDYEYQLSFALSRLDLQKMLMYYVFNVLAFC